MAKAKTQRREPADSSSGIIPINRKTWIDIERGKYSLSACEISKKVTHFFRHSQQVLREKDGAVLFCRIKNIFRVNSLKFLIGLTIDGKHA